MDKKDKNTIFRPHSKAWFNTNELIISFLRRWLFQNVLCDVLWKELTVCYIIYVFCPLFYLFFFTRLRYNNSWFNTASFFLRKMLFKGEKIHMVLFAKSSCFSCLFNAPGKKLCESRAILKWPTRQTSGLWLDFGTLVAK